MHKTSNRHFLKSPHVWTLTTYFAEGFPYTIIRIISSVFFRDMRVGLEGIGLTSLFGLAWVLKFLWGPQVDLYGTKRTWMLSTQSLLVCMILGAALLSCLPYGVTTIAVLFFIGSFIAATHDIAIDGYYMEALDEKGQAGFVGYRVMAYRIAMMTGTGVVVSIGAATNWLLGFVSAGVLLGLLFLYHLTLLPRVEKYGLPYSDLLKKVLKPKAVGGVLTALFLLTAIGWFLHSGWPQRSADKGFPLSGISLSGWIGILLLLGLCALASQKNRIKRILLRDRGSFYSRAFIAYMDRPQIGIALAFIILMRTGEAMLSSMVSPFIVDLGIKVHYGWISGGVGLPCSIVGAMIGGWAISRYSLRKTIWPFLLAQNLTNIVYMLLALHLTDYLALNTGADSPTPIGSMNLLLVAAVHGFDQLAGGLGTSVLTIFLMRTCLPAFKAAHFAIGTGLMNISGVFSGVLSGFLAEWVGYGYFFGISFLASIPGLLLIFFVPFLGNAPRQADPLPGGERVE
jgi:PAT family beta-lactamase induction signal transducer AmpG